MAKLTVSDFASFSNQLTFLTALNANFALVEAALENTLSRDGTSPNEMEADLDMNSNNIINLPAAASATEPVRLQEFQVLETEVDDLSTSVANALAEIQAFEVEFDNELAAAVSAKIAAQAAQAAAELAETNAETAETAAEAAQAAAELALDGFTDIYLGAFATEPTFDNDGGALTVGDLYFDTVLGSLRIYDGSAWQGVDLTALDDLTNVNISSPQDGQALTYDSGTSKWVNATPASTFLDLTDSPSDYTGDALKLVRVNAGETALEFFTGAFTADAISFTATGNLASTDVQAALEELDDEKQPLDSDLTSWAGVTRASGFDTFVATPTQANLFSLLTDETILVDADIGVTVQAYDADLSSWAGVTRASGFDTFVATPSQANFMSLITDETFVVDADIGSTVQAYDADLASWAGVTRASGFDTFVATPSQANFMSLITDETFVVDADIGSTVQAYDADLASWAGVTRASGFDTFAATPSLANLGSLLTDEAAGLITFMTTPSSANLRSLVTDETGTGSLVFADAPQMSTIELGHASDTTLSRLAAGRVGIEGIPIGKYTFSASAPSNPQEGDRWVDSDDLTEYTYVNDGDSSQWVSLSSPAGASYWASDSTLYDGNISYTVPTATNFAGIQVTRTDNGGFGPYIHTFHNTASPAAGDEIGGLLFWSKDSAANNQYYGALACYIDDPTNASEDSHYLLATFNAGTQSNMGFYPGGIRFPGTQIASSDANQLDDYEEGTFTPAVTGSGSNPTITYTTQVGRYTKIGRQITAHAIVVPATYSGGSGDFRISLPFTSANVSNDYSWGAWMSDGVDYIVGTCSLASQNTANQAFVRCWQTTDNAAGAAILVGAVAATDTLAFTITYNE